MNQKTAYKQGVVSGLEAGNLGDFSSFDLYDEEAFTAACGEICSDKRQYAGHPTYEFLKHHNSETLFDAFENGEAVGIRKAWRARQRAAKVLDIDRSAQPPRADSTCKLRAGNS